MLTVLQVLKNGNRIAGYVCTDGNSTTQLTKEQLAKYIDAKKVTNAHKYVYNKTLRIIIDDKVKSLKAKTNNAKEQSKPISAEEKIKKYENYIINTLYSTNYIVANMIQLYSNAENMIKEKGDRVYNKKVNLGGRNIVINMSTVNMKDLSYVSIDLGKSKSGVNVTLKCDGYNDVFVEVSSKTYGGGIIKLFDRNKNIAAETMEYEQDGYVYCSALKYGYYYIQEKQQFIELTPQELLNKLKEIIEWDRNNFLLGIL